MLDPTKPQPSSSLGQKTQKLGRFLNRSGDSGPRFPLGACVAMTSPRRSSYLGQGLESTCDVWPIQGVDQIDVSVYRWGGGLTYCVEN
jgi:hypothetical protein